MGQSFQGTDRQGNSLPLSQREFPMLGVTRRPVMVPDDLIRHCEDRLDAIRLCVHLSNFSHEHISSSLGIDRGHWSRIMQGRAWFPDPLSVRLMELCGNLAPMQYEAYRMGYILTDGRDARIAELEKELAQVRAA